MTLDSTGAATALAAVAAAGLFEGVTLLHSIGDPVPYYDDAHQDVKDLLSDFRRLFPAAKSQQLKVLALGTVAAAVTAWGLRDSHPTAAAAFGVMAAANVASGVHTMHNMMPLNNRLMAPDAETKEEPYKIRSLLQQWGKLHSLRTVLGAVALGASLYGTHTLLTGRR